MRSEDGVNIPNRIFLLQLITDAVTYPIDFVRVGLVLVPTRRSDRLASSNDRKVPPASLLADDQPRV